MKNVILAIISISIITMSLHADDSYFTSLNEEFNTDVLNDPNSGWGKIESSSNPDLANVTINIGAACLFQSWGEKENANSKFAKLYYEYSQPSPFKPWKISSRLKWIPNGTDFGVAEKSFSLFQGSDFNSDPLFEIKVKGSTQVNTEENPEYTTTIIWNTPTESGQYLKQKMNIKADSFSDLSIEYDPTSGYVEFKIDNASIYKGVTDENITIKSILLSNMVSDSGWNEGMLFVDNVKSEIVPSTTTILHGMNGGDFNTSKPNIVAGGQWTYWANWTPSAKVNWLQDQFDNENGCIELFQEWYPHNARITYTDNETTPTDKAWRISVDLKGSYTTRLRSDLFYLLDENGSAIFTMEIIGKIGDNSTSTLNWVAGSKSGTLSNVCEVDDQFFKSFSFEYNASSGKAVGLSEGKKLFETFTEQDLRVKSVCVENRTYDANRWDPGTLYVDNFKTEVITDLSNDIVLNDINGGDFSNISLETTGGTTVHGGWWQGWTIGGANASVNIIGDGDGRHVELSQEWYPRKANVMYVDYNGTPDVQAWKVSADIKGSYTRHYRDDVMELQGENGNTIIKVLIRGEIGGNTFNDASVYQWSFYDPATNNLIQIDSVLNAVEINDDYQNISIEYNPLSGELIGYFNEIEIFRTIIDMNIKIYRVAFSNSTNSNTYDPGTLFVDNIKSEPVQNRDIQFRGIATKSLNYEALSAIKNKFNANQVRYYIAPKYAANNIGDHVVNTYPFWDAEISYLTQGLDNARKLGLAVVINVHQVPSVNRFTQPAIWANSTESEKFKYCWRQITDITQHRDQVIWLELYNEPNVNWNDPCVMQTSWNILAQQTIDEIRGKHNLYDNLFVDRKHPIVFSSGPGALDWGFRWAPIMMDDYFPVIYSLHQWEADEYTHYGQPNKFPIATTPIPSRPTKGQAREYMQFSKQFQDFYGVKMWVGEFGALKDAPERNVWVKEHIELFEEYGWGWTYWAWDSPFSLETSETMGTSNFTDIGKQLHNALMLNN